MGKIFKNQTALKLIANVNQDVTGAPQFVLEASRDYNLDTGSPAIDAGSDASLAP